MSISLIMTILLFSACASDTQPKKTVSSAKSSPIQIKPAYEPNFGDTETIGDLQYTFISLNGEDTVGSGNHTATGEKQLYSVLITVKNIGDQAVTVNPSFFTLISGSKTYSVAEMATLYKNEREPEGDTMYRDKLREQFASGVPQGTILTTLEPGEEKNGYLIFDVDPTEAFIAEEEGAPVVEKLEIKSNRSDGETLIFYFY